jgi:hypothetical protein
VAKKPVRSGNTRKVELTPLEKKARRAEFKERARIRKEAERLSGERRERLEKRARKIEAAKKRAKKSNRSVRAISSGFETNRKKH